jgi:hypothetical protein
MADHGLSAEFEQDTLHEAHRFEGEIPPDEELTLPKLGRHEVEQPPHTTIGAGAEGFVHAGSERIDDDPPGGPLRPVGPRGSRAAAAPLKGSAFERAMKAFPKDRRDKLQALKEKNGYRDDDPIWGRIELIGVAEQVSADLPRRLSETLDNIVSLAAQELATSAAAVNTEEIGDRLSVAFTDMVLDRLGDSVVSAMRDREAHWRAKWGVIGGGFVLGALLAGYFLGERTDLVGARSRYDAELTGIPHVRNVVRTATGLEFLGLIQKNGTQALDDIAHCRGEAGLRLERSQSDELVCVGAGGGRRGWRIVQ